MEIKSKTKQILSSQIEKDPLFDTTKKVIGIGSKNLIPDAQGVAPLSKQNTFVQEDTANIGALDALAATDLSEVAETMEFGAPILPAKDVSEVISAEGPTGGKFIPAPGVVSDTLAVSAVDTADPRDLENLILPVKSVEEPATVVPTEESVNSTKSILDQHISIQFPAEFTNQDKELHGEPTKIDEDLFEPIEAATPDVPKAESTSVQALEPVNQSNELPQSEQLNDVKHQEDEVVRRFVDGMTAAIQALPEMARRYFYIVDALHNSKTFDEFKEKIDNLKPTDIKTDSKVETKESAIEPLNSTQSTSMSVDNPPFMEDFAGTLLSK